MLLSLLEILFRILHESLSAVLSLLVLFDEAETKFFPLQAGVLIEFLDFVFPLFEFVLES